jgi:hypothetical protein
MSTTERTAAATTSRAWLSLWAAATGNGYGFASLGSTVGTDPWGEVPGMTVSYEGGGRALLEVDTRWGSVESDGGRKAGA